MFDYQPHVDDYEAFKLNHWRWVKKAGVMKIFNTIMIISALIIGIIYNIAGAITGDKLSLILGMLWLIFANTIEGTKKL